MPGAPPNTPAAFGEVGLLRPRRSFQTPGGLLGRTHVPHAGEGPAASFRCGDGEKAAGRGRPTATREVRFATCRVRLLRPHILLRGRPFVFERDRISKSFA